MQRQIRKVSRSSKRSKRSKRSKHSKHSKYPQRGGAIYSFDLNDKIGGQPANIPLNGTADGDCPGSDTKDLGFVNYGKTVSGGNRMMYQKNKKSHKKTNKKFNKKSRKNNKKNKNKSI